MNQRAQKVWQTFCAELTYPSSEDQKEALATVLRTIVEQFQYYSYEGMVVSSQELIDLADELDNKDMENYGGNTPIVPDDTMEEILKNGVRK
jgi:hypothetical protein